MLCHARLEVESKDPEAVVKALKPDDPEWCSCWADNRIVIEVRVEKIGTLLSALDDYLINIKMCEGVLEVLG
ncbi:KEOPS complex subunit Pcc1 [Archaeoglobus sp.]|uniref:KEOPS complex subunit Pcc1 n=1 Tax=Archaeoglobus sp. TaxID=1872626 RepID=UPI002590B008|nr:KEOPS complex subunit Pcc1 [Archaeoglobus sp.]